MLWFTSLSRDLEVGHGFSTDCASLQNGEVSASVQQESWGSDTRAPPADDNSVNPGKSFLGKFAGKRRKEGFSANDCCTSPDPDFSSLPNFHPLIERSSAEDVWAICQVSSARAKSAIDYERWSMSDFDFSDIWLSDLIFNL